MDTIVAPITPLITSSIITIRISGDNTLDILKFLKTIGNKSYEILNPREVYYAKFINNNDFLVDNIIFYYFKAPYSYTGEDIIEISFHGNPLIVREALACIYSLGIRSAEPGEFTKRAFLNGKLDLTQAEAVSDVISAKSDKGLYYAFNKLKGGLKNQIGSVKDSLINVAAIVEAYIDFPEEDIGDAEYQMIVGHLGNILLKTDALLKTYDQGKVCDDSINVAIVGKPNSGKSSLLNALTQKSRAIVSDIPGTTRDYIEETIYLSGTPVNIIDTAGIRKTDDEIESIGVRLAIDKLETADIVLVVIDVSSPLTDDDIYILDITKNISRIIIGNKSDIKIIKKIFSDINISAKEMVNIDKLIEMMKSGVILVDSEVFQSDIVISERHKVLLQNIYITIELLKDSFERNSLDLISMDINICLNDLGEITGENYTEEILETIFNKFCIGK